MFFEPVGLNTPKKEGLNSQIKYFGSTFPKWEDCSAAVLSVGGDFSSIRRAINELTELTHPISIADLGILRQGEDKEATLARLTQVCCILLKSNIIPIVLSSEADCLQGQFGAYKELNKMAHLLCIDKTIDLEKPHIATILLDKNLFMYSHLGYQRFRTHNTTLQNLFKLNYELKSIGQMRDDFKEVEASLRNADLVSFDMSALRGKGVFGLSGEEACQICWYSGVSPRLSGFSITGLRDEAEHSEVAAAMVWYLLEGLSSFESGRNLSLNHCKKFIVSNHQISRDIVFFQNELTGQWWLEIPVSQEGRNPIWACSEADYLSAQSGELPERWLRGIETYLG